MATSFIGRADLPLGLRNNNPGDIKPGDAWQGMVGVNEGFIVFQDITWGVRALATDLVNKINRGINTIQAIVTEYAPASDNNDVPAYVAAVSNDTGLDPNQVIPLDEGTIHDLVRAFMNHELGDQYSALVSDDDIDTGISMSSSQVLSLLQAAQIAVTAAVTDPAGPASTPGLVILGGAAIFIYLLWPKK